MKFWLVLVAVGAKSVPTHPLRAQSLGIVAGRLPQSGSSAIMQPSEISTATNSADLPDAPQSNPMSSTQALPFLAVGTRPLLPQTFHDKFMAFAVTTVGPRAWFIPAFPAAIRMVNPPNHYPPEWRQGAQAYARNYGDELATAGAFETGRFVAGAALHEDFRYHPSTSTNFFLRTGHALAFTFVDRSDDGHARLAIANFAGLTAEGYVGMSYLPAGFNDVTHADQRLAIRFGTLAGSNLGAEFASDIFRFLAEHHLPIPRIPIPEWWIAR